MESQIQQAVEIAVNPSSSPDLRQEALNFLEEVKGSSQSWTACLSLLYQNDASDSVKLFAFQIIDNAVSNLSVEELDVLKNSLLQYLNKILNDEVPDNFFLKNKLAATFSYLFYYSYLNIWPSFFKTFIKLIEKESDISRKQRLIDYYIRILLSVHSEIGDQIFVKSNKESVTSTQLKDIIRMNDMSDIVASWKYIMNNCNDLEILKNLLQCIGNWVSWIDINLVIDNGFLQDFYKIFDSDNLRSEICDLFIEIISKKMPSEKKMDLLNLMSINELILSNLKLPSNELDGFDDDSVAFLEHLSKLLNTLGIEYLIVIEKGDSPLNVKQLAFEKLNQLLPLILKIIPNDYDDISFQIFPFISNFLTILKKISKSGQNNIINVDNYTKFLGDLLACIILKMKYDENDDGLSDEDDDEDAQEFNELRNKLKVFQESISAICPDMFVFTISNVINQTLFNNESSANSILNNGINDTLNGSNDTATNNDNNIKDIMKKIASRDIGKAGDDGWRPFELGLYELSNFSDILRSNTMKLPKNEIQKSKPFLIFQKFLLDLISNKNNLSIDHPLIQLTFLELIIRHYSFFVSGLNENNALTNNILEIINSRHGLFNEHSKVQKRCFYLFSRFIKLTKPTLDFTVLQSLIASLLNLLIIKAKVSEESSIQEDSVDITVSSNESNEEDESSDFFGDSFFESQLYLYETLGVLIGLSLNKFKLANEFDGLCDEILNPIFQDLKKCMEIYPNFSFPLDKQQIVLQAHHCLIAIGTFIKGFENCNDSSKQLINSKFVNISEVVVVILDNFKTYKIIRDSARHTFGRLINVCDLSSISHNLTSLISIILSNENMTSQELSFFMGFIGQIIHSFNKNSAIYQLLNELISTLFNKVYKILNILKVKISQQNEAVLKTDAILSKLTVQKQNLEKSYLTFILSMINNHVLSLLINDTNKETFPSIVDSIFQYVNDFEDTMIVKMALNILENFVNTLSKGVLNDENDINKFNVGKLDGIDEYLLKNSINCCFELPFKNPKFNAKDAQSKLILNELSFFLKILFKNYGEILVNYLQGVYFVEIQLPSDLSNEFLQNLVNSDDKAFKQFFYQFVVKLFPAK